MHTDVMHKMAFPKKSEERGKNDLNIIFPHSNIHKIVYFTKSSYTLTRLIYTKTIKLRVKTKKLAKS